MGHQARLLLWGILICIVIIVGAFFVYKLGALNPSQPSSPQPLAPTGPTAGCGVLPLDVMLVIDRSASMVQTSNQSGTPPQTRLYYAKQAADALIDKLDQNGGLGGTNNPAHQVGVVSFGGLDAAGIRLDLALGNNNATAIKNAIDNLNGDGGTPLRQAMLMAANEMTAHHRTTVNGKAVQHVIILLSDGSPDPLATETPTAADISKYLKSAETLYAIAIGQGGTGSNGVDLNLMKSIAKPTPAKFRQVTTGDQLPALFNDIFTEIACQTADLSLTKAVDNPAPKQNDTVTFTLTVTNDGPDSVDGVTVKDVLPAGLDQPSQLPANFDGTTWTVGTLASSAKASLTIVSKVSAAPSTALTNIAEIMTSSLADPDSTPGNGVTTEDDYASVALKVADAVVNPPPPPPPPPPTTPSTPAPTPAPTAAPSSGYGGWGELLYALIGLFVLGGFGLTIKLIKRSR